jgi:hypothetical protein
MILSAFICQKQIRSYKKQTSTNYANKISDKAGDYSGMRQHSLKFTRAPFKIIHKKSPLFLQDLKPLKIIYIILGIYYM